ncbi:DUF1090 family protein [Vibrio sp. HA2012]|uniref:DUF1090 family protein n=1 Tax=Vibrio sp. HA2012 TaxID=1971595 RepID=UPI0012FE3B26|nr:DUF1090 family protein [Vibrio sp. HA2012]
MNKVKKITPHFLTYLVTSILLSGSTLAAHATSSCAGLSGCNRNICEKEYELEKAKEYGDVGKILGLQNSLVHLKDSCAQNPGLAQEEYQEELEELNDEYKEDLDDALDEYEDDLAEAKSDGKTTKILRAKEKYDLKIQEITAEYERKLKQLQVTK